jgi:hypothetical protein
VHVVLNVAVGVPNRFHEHPVSSLKGQLKRHETCCSKANSSAPYRAVMSMVLYVRGRGDALGPACTCTYSEYGYQPAPPLLGLRESLEKSIVLDERRKTTRGLNAQDRIWIWLSANQNAEISPNRRDHAQDRPNI